MFDFRLSFKVSGNHIDVKDNEIRLFSKKEVYLKSSQENKSIAETRDLTVLGKGFKTYREAAIEMLRVEQALKISVLKEHIGIINTNSGHNDYPLNKILGEMERPYLLKGMMFDQLLFRRVYKADTFFWNPAPSVDSDPIDYSIFKNNCEQFYRDYDVAFSLLPAIDLLNSIQFEYSSKVRLILSMTVVEMLAEVSNSRTEEEVELINKFISEVENSTLDSNQKKSLSLAIDGCKYFSISNSCKRIIKNKLGKKKAESFYNLYNYRSRIVHSGDVDDSLNDNKEKVTEIYKAAGEAYLLAFELVEEMLKEHKNNGEPQFSVL